MIHKKSLKTVFTYSFTLLIIICVLFVGTLTIIVSTYYLREEITKRNETIIGFVTHRINEELNRIYEELVNYKNNIEIINIENTGLQKFIDYNINHHSSIFKIQISDREGIIRVISPYDKEFINYDVSGYPYFKVTMKTEQPYWSTAFISPQLNQPSATLSLPIDNGIITGFLDLSKILQTSRLFTHDSKYNIAIVDQTGTYIAHNDRSKVLIRETEKYYKSFYKAYNGSLLKKKISIDGKTTICNVAFIHQTGWAVILYQSNSEVYQPLIRLIIFLVIFIILIFVGAVTLSTHQVKSIVSTIHHLIQNTKIIAGGSYDFITLEGRYQELGELADHFNTMVKSVHEREQELGKYRKHLEDLVKSRTIKLEREIQERKKAEKELKNAKEAAESANNAKSLFLSNMSHELRTPLNSILGYTQLMGRDKSFPRAYSKSIEIIQRSGDHLLYLINEILEMSKIESGKLTLNNNNFNLYTSLEIAKEIMNSKAHANNIQLILTIDPHVPVLINADEYKLRQVIINLINNAIKYTDEGSITLNVSTIPLQDQCKIQFKIIDTGIGIAKDDLPRIFDAFIQAKKEHGARKGTGLGLSICRKYIQLMGGDISVESELNKGSTFTFDIMYHPANSEIIPHNKPEKKVIGLKDGQESKQILIVEDIDENRFFVKTLLDMAGFATLEAANGRDALEMFKKEQPDLILMDLQMPHMDGYEAIHEIRLLSGGKQVVIIALTAIAFEEDRKKVLNSGADDFIRKPFHESELFEKIAGHLNLEYIYDKTDYENTSVISNESEIVSAIHQLPTDIVDKLKEASLNYDVQNITSAISSIAEINKALADKLENFTKEFEYEKILYLINE